jgi:hypothetical protein
LASSLLPPVSLRSPSTSIHGLTKWYQSQVPPPAKSHRRHTLPPTPSPLLPRGASPSLDPARPPRRHVKSLQIDLAYQPRWADHPIRLVDRRGALRTARPATGRPRRAFHRAPSSPTPSRDLCLPGVDAEPDGGHDASAIADGGDDDADAVQHQLSRSGGRYADLQPPTHWKW